jgi:Na+-transporting NADH:ubiquinone oxidoreductase subunit NqrF
MRRFNLVEPTTLEEACGLIANDDDAKVIAGGTALSALIKHGIFVSSPCANSAGARRPGGTKRETEECLWSV